MTDCLSLTVAKLRYGWPVSCRERSYYYATSTKGSIEEALKVAFAGVGTVESPIPGPAAGQGFELQALALNLMPRLFSVVCRAQHPLGVFRSCFDRRITLELLDSISKLSFCRERVQLLCPNPPVQINSRRFRHVTEPSDSLRAWKVSTNERVSVPRCHRGCIE